MGAYLYDEAFLKKLQNWTRNTEVTLFGTDDSTRFLEVLADKSDDKPIKLPVICLRRPGGYSIDTQGKKPLSFDGITMGANEQRSQQLNAIPISLNYQIDIMARYYREADEYARNIIFNVINYPRLEVTLPYEGANYKHVGQLKISQEIVDNSAVAERLAKGQFSILSLAVSIDDAYLFDIRTRQNCDITFQIYEHDSVVND